MLETLQQFRLTILSTPAHDIMTVLIDTTKYRYGRKYATNNKQFLATFLDRMFP